MQFLLLLSALLSAVTGAFVGPRPVDGRMGQAEAQIVAPAQAAARAETVAASPSQPCQRQSRRRPAPPRPGSQAPLPGPLMEVCLIE